MKKLVTICSLALVLAGSVSAATLPGDFESEKTKSYSKTYAVGSGDKILLDNSFGEMKINTWNKNEIKVDVNITVKASTDDGAQKIIDMITIEDGKNGSGIFFKTHYKDDKKYHDGDEAGSRNRNNNSNHNQNDNDNSSTRINYTVYLPANAILDATNQFGPLTIGDYDGVLTLSCKFGTLTAGKLSQPKKVEVQFGKGTIESINNGKLSVQFSSAVVNKLSGDISADINQSHGVKINLDNNLKKLDITNNFSDVLLDAEKNLSASFNIKSSFGKFINETSFPVNNNRDEEDRYMVTTHTYSGKAGSGNTSINIKSNFGKVILGHDMPFDVNEKSNHKNGGKEKIVKKRTNV